MSTPTKHRVRRVQVSIPSPILVNCVEDYIAECIAKGLKPRTVESHKLALKHLVQCVTADSAWYTVPAIRRAVASLRNRSYADASVSMYLRSWRAFLHFCLAEGLIQDDLAASIKPPKTEPRRDVILSVTDVHALIDSTRAGLNPERDEAILTVMYDCGLRAGEVCALRIRHVDMGSRTLTVPSGKTGGRSVPIGRITAKALRRWLILHPLAHQYDSPLFPSKATLGALTRQSLAECVYRLGARSGISVHPHQLRHTFAVTYLRNGGDVFSLQRILGHSSLVMTRWYAQLADTDVQARHNLASPADRLGKTR